MSVDPFSQLERPVRTQPPVKGAGHAERAHSKFSASGAERWFNCSGSVKLSEGVPDKSNVWSIEGTEAHEVLEALLLFRLNRKEELKGKTAPKSPGQMLVHADHAASFMLNLYHKTPEPREIMVETRIYLDFIHPEMFGTFDGAVVDHFGTLHVFDYKYGAGHFVSPTENLQMIFYGIGLAHRFEWNFKRVRLWIIQPRVKGYDGPLFWEVETAVLRGYVKLFREAVKRVEENPNEYREGSWCHWCKAKSKCPLKQEKKIQEAQSIFSMKPLDKKYLT